MPDVDRVVFVHGSGRSGRDAWPLQQGVKLARQSVYLTRPGFGADEEPVRTDFAAEANMVVAACGRGAHVVAASYGAIAALGAVALAPEAIRSVVLIEPTVFSLGRGLPAVEAHIRALQPVMNQAPRLAAADFLVKFFTALGAVDPVRPTTTEALRVAERMRLQRPPWEANFDPAVIRFVPTLVVTGNWNPEYEELAARLGDLGATHVHVPGRGHAAQDVEEFNDILRQFWMLIGG
jgi:pimeloyl-ACP methyl ester carboxylesterase